MKTFHLVIAINLALSLTSCAAMDSETPSSTPNQSVSAPKNNNIPAPLCKPVKPIKDMKSF